MYDGSNEAVSCSIDSNNEGKSCSVRKIKEFISHTDMKSFHVLFFSYSITIL